MKYKLSIIIPIYNVENYIEACLDSIFVQILDNVEVILINDGTPDKSVDIIRSHYGEWLAKDQVVLIEQENAGPGAARNAGLDVARGEYIGFLDSDDVLLEDYFSTILETINGHNVDIVEFGFQRFYDLPHKDEYISLYTLKGFYALKKVRNKIFAQGVWFPSTRIYKREIFQDVRFPVGVFYEDLMTIPFIYLKEYNIYLVDKPLIGYRYNPNSTTALHTLSHLDDMYSFYMRLKECETTVALQILKIRVARSISYFYNELEPSGFSIEAILTDVRNMPKHLVILRNLKIADFLFYLFPDLYMQIDTIRLKKKKG